MSRLLIHVEGQTEEEFVNEVLQDVLLASGYHSVSARLIGNARLRQHRGGIRPWVSVRRDIVNHLKEDRGCIATTMVDYYALPKSWPGRGDAVSLRFPQRASFVEDALLADLAVDVDASRFVPYVVMHEFEALLFSDCIAFCNAIGRADLEVSFQAIRNEFSTPEEINDSPISAPSKRVTALVPGYQKPFHGVLAALEIGLNRIRAECPHFNDWLFKLARVVGPR
jgi:hypothetical protein